MESFTGFLIWIVVVVLVAVVVSKRGRSVWMALAAMVLGSPALVVLVSLGTHGNGLAMGWSGFLIPMATFFFVLASGKSEAIAIERGEHGAFKKCPFCAESVRKEAIKCKHCGSDLQAKPAD